MDIAGGPPQTICDAPTGRRLLEPDGVILFDGAPQRSVWRVPAAVASQSPKSLDDRQDGTATPGWPMFLPDGEHFLYTIISGTDQTVMVGQARLARQSSRSSRRRSRVLYAEPGYLLYVRDHTLVAQRFDAQSLTLEGEAVPHRRRTRRGLGRAWPPSRCRAPACWPFAAASCRAGGSCGSTGAGKETPVIDAVGDYHDTWFSPDGKRLVFDAGTQRRRPRSLDPRPHARRHHRFTFEAGRRTRSDLVARRPSHRLHVAGKGTGDLYVKDASGTKDAEPLLVHARPRSTCPTGRGMARTSCTRVRGDRRRLGHLGAADDGRRPQAVFRSSRRSSTSLCDSFSPDGKYIAYQSNESGRPEIYVQEFPDARNKWQVSTEGGTESFWRGDGKELFYRSGHAPHGRAGPDGALLQRRHSSRALPGALRLGPRARPLPAVAGRPAVPRARRARPRAEQPASVVLNWTAALPK